MNQHPLQVYSNPETGYWGKTKMIRKYKHILNDLYAQQRHREIKAPQMRKMYRKIEASRPFESVQVDLAFLPKLKSPLNHNIWGFIVVIDVYSRYLWIKTFTNRRALHIPLESVLQEMKMQFGRTPTYITGDNEFATTRLQQLAANYDFKWYFADAHEKFRTGIGERVIRTIKNLIKRYLAHNNTTKYIDILPQLINNYNNTYHRIIRTTPYNAITQNVTHEKKQYNDIPALKLGQKVRVLKPRNKFTKGDVPYYSHDVYEIVGRDLNRYILRHSETGNELRKRYARHQLLPIKRSIRGDSIQNQEKSDDSLGYDEGIEENARRNRFNASMNRMGIEIDDINDPNDVQEAMSNQMDMENEIQDDEPPQDDFGRIDDMDAKYDKLNKLEYTKLPTNANGACLFNLASNGYSLKDMHHMSSEMTCQIRIVEFGGDIAHKLHASM